MTTDPATGAARRRVALGDDDATTTRIADQPDSSTCTLTVR
ncbi:hypothetical protein ACIHAX_13410 [Nocardia sp. NPDC051929]